ncbi:MAG: hypothetical protein MMC23_002839 [Stictis urceolatum]|nr:hypothetical protein [Stictis urceolata]
MMNEHSRATIAVNTVFPALSAVFIALRIRARQIKHSSLKLDDYIIVAALIFTLGQSLPFAYCAIKGGMGQHLADLSYHEITIFGKVAFWTQLPYLLAVTLIKVSILLFYRAIFTTIRFRLAVKVFLLVIGAWTIAFFFASLFQALPLSYNWNQNQPGSSINEYAMYQALACTELTFDVITLCMPWLVVWNLQMKTSRKLAVCGLFTLGGL